jgi:hypothetical protein
MRFTVTMSAAVIPIPTTLGHVCNGGTALFRGRWPRKIYFEPQKTICAIATCGGLSVRSQRRYSIVVARPIATVFRAFWAFLWLRGLIPDWHRS